MSRLVFAAALMAAGFSVVSVAHADPFRPGASPAGGRIGKVCGSSYLSKTEQDDCYARMKAAKNNAERKEIRDVLQQNQKERQKELDIKNENANIGGPGSKVGGVLN